MRNNDLQGVASNTKFSEIHNTVVTDDGDTLLEFFEDFAMKTGIGVEFSFPIESELDLQRFSDVLRLRKSMGIKVDITPVVEVFDKLNIGQINQLGQRCVDNYASPQGVQA